MPFHPDPTFPHILRYAAVPQSNTIWGVEARRKQNKWEFHHHCHFPLFRGNPKNVPWSRNSGEWHLLYFLKCMKSSSDFSQTQKLSYKASLGVWLIFLGILYYVTCLHLHVTQRSVYGQNITTLTLKRPRPNGHIASPSSSWSSPNKNQQTEVNRKSFVRLFLLSVPFYYHTHSACKQESVNKVVAWWLLMEYPEYKYAYNKNRNCFQNIWNPSEEQDVLHKIDMGIREIHEKFANKISAWYGWNCSFISTLIWVRTVLVVVLRCGGWRITWLQAVVVTEFPLLGIYYFSLFCHRHHPPNVASQTTVI